MKLGVNFWVGLMSGMLAALVVSVLLGLVVLGLRGTYFFLASFAFTEVVMLVFTRWTNPFGGAAGIMFIPLPDPNMIPGLLRLF
jgi:branched-chain amino acid transport system permease protein